jgi:hypothetical protein
VRPEYNGMSKHFAELTPYIHATNLKAERVRAAQEAYEAYDFGTLLVELRGQANWTFAFGESDAPIMFRTITIFNDRSRENPILAQFIVEFESQNAMPVKAYARSDKRTFFGSMPDGYFDTLDASVGRKRS